MNDLSDRYVRQNDIIDRNKIQDMAITVVGCGAIGREVAIKLANIGVPELRLIDHDIVDVVNLAPQGFYEADVGQSKVDAIARSIGLINSDTVVIPLCEKFAIKHCVADVIFCCVDSIKTRGIISSLSRASLFLDARMAAENCQVFSVFDKDSKEFYKTTLFNESEAYTGSCTGRSTNYCAGIAANIMISQFTKWLRGINPDKRIDFNIFSMEISVEQ